MIPAYELPPLHLSRVYIDFDGTLSARDVLDELIRGYAADRSWEVAERQWQEGIIGSRRCLEIQVGLVRIDDDELEQFVDRVKLDEGAIGLLDFLAKQAVPATILSDGLDILIGRVLARHGIGEKVGVRCNKATRHGKGLALEFPYASEACRSGAGHCKCDSSDALRRIGEKTIYIGDGRSDLCAARKADFVFAKKVLADLLTAEGVPFVRYSTLADVQRYMQEAWAGCVDLAKGAR
ncbi:MAG TPA: MtnX-like HAD-IB family phosphatase [Tepidisphaeraceae bacterium]|jgi:2,3-diketo-5-methylthio-1-phosphopentane phosphatase|nr:MtnX-like HAD-IB family phosphatase [Tepidisphaeraceae bacterium]